MFDLIINIEEIRKYAVYLSICRSFHNISCILFETEHDNTNKMSYALSEDLDKPNHRCPHEEALGSWVPI